MRWILNKGDVLMKINEDNSCLRKYKLIIDGYNSLLRNGKIVDKNVFKQDIKSFDNSSCDDTISYTFAGDTVYIDSNNSCITSEIKWADIVGYKIERDLLCTFYENYFTIHYPTTDETKLADNYYQFNKKEIDNNNVKINANNKDINEMQEVLNVYNTLKSKSVNGSLADFKNCVELFNKKCTDIEYQVNKRTTFYANYEVCKWSDILAYNFTEKEIELYILTFCSIEKQVFNTKGERINSSRIIDKTQIL